MQRYPTRRFYNPRPAAPGSGGGSIPGLVDDGVNYSIARGLILNPSEAPLAFDSRRYKNATFVAGTSALGSTLNAAGFANNTMFRARVTTIGIETTTPGASGFSIISERSFRVTSGGVYTAVGAGTSTLDGNDVGTNFLSHGLVVNGNNIQMDFVFNSVVAKSYSVTYKVEIIRTT